LTNTFGMYSISIKGRLQIMPIVTKEIKIQLLVLVIAMLLAWLCFGPEVLKYMGPVILLWQ